MRAVEKLLTSKRLLAHLSRAYSPVAMYQTFCPEDIVLAHLIFSDLVHSEYKNIHMFTIDTGRTSDEIYRAIENLQQRYGDVLKVYHPETRELEKFDADNGFGRDYYQRSSEIRFHKPLMRALDGHNAWISTSHGNNSFNRDKAWINWDSNHQIPCFNPLTRWTQEEIRHYARHHGLAFVDPRIDQANASDYSVAKSNFEIYPATAVGVS